MSKRAPRARAGQLKAKWGAMEGDAPDLLYGWGPGVSRSDAHLLHNTLTAPRYSPFEKEWSSSFLEELEERGYDISTLTFSVEKKRPTS